ncbi:hypothetical protein DFH94DRAFT_453071 [Russula ochroleuca]|uniref:Uncharacterized protein n=1 Tax=Russula ochroleuca TaxID=152965 RepID=A0A9P5MPW8_9AGAM|nr:hypothetical protein DFH94DRAFT_453071 [Russula ochroleuca]
MDGSRCSTFTHSSTTFVYRFKFGAQLLSHHLSRCPARVILLAKSHDGLRRHFAGTGNKERGDFYLDRSFVLLHQRCLGSIEKDYIGRMYISAKDANGGRSKETYKKLVKTSCQVIDEELMNLIIYFMARRSAGERMISSSLMSQVNNYLFDFQSVFSIPMDVAISHPGQVVVETHPSEVTGQGQHTRVRWTGCVFTRHPCQFCTRCPLGR